MAINVCGLATLHRYWDTNSKNLIDYLKFFEENSFIVFMELEK